MNSLDPDMRWSGHATQGGNAVLIEQELQALQARLKEMEEEKTAVSRCLSSK